jgi:hypothetical protein
MMRKAVLLLVPAAMLFAGVSLVSSTPSEILLSVSLPAPAVSIASVNGTDYAVLSVPEAGISSDVGAPQVPVIRKLVEIPYGAEVAVRLAGIETGQMVLPNRLLPVQPPIPKTGPAPAFALDEKAYAASAFLPGTWAAVQSVAEVRNHRVALVEIYPARYNPGTGTVEYLTTANVELSLSGADLEKTRRLFREFYSPPFEKMLRGLVLNFGAYESDGPPGLPVGFLVIVPDAWYSTVLPLAQWRRQKGLEVTVTKLSTIGGGGSTQVLAYIQNAYNNWPIKPSYVLLVGDVDSVGYFIGQGEGNPHTDLNYSMLAGSDYLPDICVSRASVTGVAQLDSLVKKTVKYEKNIWLNGTDWCKKAFFIASADGGNHGVAERTHQYCMGKIRPMGVTCDSQYLYYDNARSITVNKINEGRAWVIYSGHGAENEWAEHSPLFDVTTTHALTNADKAPFVATFACLAGDFTSTSYPECFSESWIRSGFRGAISHMASSVTSYWTEDDTFQRRLFDCLYDSSYAWIMAAINRAKIWYFAQMGNTATTRRYFEMYNLMGDGAVDLYWDVPHALAVTHPLVIPIGATNLHITVQDNGSPVRNALVCAAGRNDTLVHAMAYTNASGVVDLAITTTGPDSVLVTVTGHNLAPYLGAALALPSSGPYVMLLKHIIDDAAPGGNADGIVNPGETVNLPVWVKNYGQGAGSGITGKLRSSDPAVTILDSAKTIGDIAAGDSAFTGSDGFKFQVSDTCTNGHNLAFTLICRDVRDTTWTSPFSIPVGTGILSYETKRVYDPPPGNNNGRIDPDETAQLFVSLRNTGMGHSHNVRATLRSGDSRFTVSDSVGAYGTILKDSSGENSADPFVVHADAGILPETGIPCTLYVTADGGYSTRTSFAVVVGEIRSTDPIPDNMTPPTYWGYDDVDSGYVEHPIFNWIELRGRGTQLTLSDDQTVTVGLPTAFGPWEFYGQRATQVSICSNGFVMPGSYSTTNYTNQALPTTALAAPAVCLDWNDLYPPAGNGVWWFHDTANHCFVVEYDSVCYYSPREQWDKYEVMIYDTTRASPDGQNKILVQYLTANNYTANTVGIQNSAGTYGINCLFDGAYTRGAAPIGARSATKYVSGNPVTGILEPSADAKHFAAVALAISPNPCLGRAQIRLSVRVAGKVALRVFDISGREVRTLCNASLPPGSYNLDWNATDNSGSAIAAGLYFVKLETAGNKATEKLILAR